MNINHLTSKFILVLVLFFSSIITLATNAKKQIHIVIQTSFEKSKTTWGTYNLTREKTYAYNKTGNVAGQQIIKKNHSPIGNLILKNGKFIFIIPSSKDGLTKLKVKSFPYYKDEKNFIVNVNGDKNNSLDLYKAGIINLLKNNPSLNNHQYHIKSDAVNFEDMNCKKIKKKFHCELPLTISIVENSIAKT